MEKLCCFIKDDINNIGKFRNKYICGFVVGEVASPGVLSTLACFSLSFNAFGGGKIRNSRAPGTKTHEG